MASPVALGTGLVGSQPMNSDSYQPLCNRCMQTTQTGPTNEPSYCQHCDGSDEGLDDSTLLPGDDRDNDSIDHIVGKEEEPDFPEGGWGWVIVVACFFNSFLFDGLGSCYGVLYPYVHEKFQASAFVTSMAGSMFGAFLIMGSPAALLVKRFGFRAVSFTGGLLSCVALVMASQASNIFMFLLTYGVMGGASVGLVYIPTVVIVNGYFNKKRGLTNGIISSGAGMGLLVMAPVINALLHYYSLSGALLILAGVLLNICVFSSSFRQPKVYDNRRRNVPDHDKEVTCLLNKEDNSEDNTEESTIDNSTEYLQQMDGGKAGNIHNNIDHEKSKSNHTFTSRRERQVACPSLVITPYLEIDKQDTSFTDKPHLLTQTDKFLFRELKTNHSQSGGKLNIAKTPEKFWMRSLNLLPTKNDFQRLDDDYKKHHKYHSTNIYTDIGANFYLTGSVSHLVKIHNQHFASAHQLHALTSHQNTQSLSTIPSNIAHGPDQHHIIKNYAIKNKGESLSEVTTNKLTCDDDLRQLQNSDSMLKTNDTLCSIENIQDMSGYSLRQLLRMGSFYLFCAGACLIQLGYPVPNIFLSDLAASHGIPHHHGALMISIIGSFNIGGRLLGGALANLNFNPIQLNDIAMFLASVLCFLCPLYTNTWSLFLFAASYGFLLGFFPPLQPLIIVKYFGIGSLASTFGFVTSVKGVAGVIGPPLAGWMYDLSQDYSISIMFAGVVFLLSVIVNETLVYITRHHPRYS